MGELTFEGLAAKIASLENQLGTVATDAANAVQTANEAKSIAESAVTSAINAGLTAIKSGGKDIAKPEIPAGEFEHEGKKYVCLKAKFRLAGDPTLHLSQEMVATAGNKDGLFAKILKIEGQDILKEVV